MDDDDDGDVVIIVVVVVVVMFTFLRCERKKRSRADRSHPAAENPAILGLARKNCES